MWFMNRCGANPSIRWSCFNVFCLITPIFTQPSPWTGLGQCVAFLSVCLSACVCVTIFLHILLLTLNYHSPPLYAGIFILLKLLKSKHWRRDQLGPV